MDLLEHRDAGDRRGETDGRPTRTDGPAFFKSGPFAYHGLLAFYLPVVIWGGYIALTTWYMLQELNRSPDQTQMPVRAETASADTSPKWVGRGTDLLAEPPCEGVYMVITCTK